MLLQPQSTVRELTASAGIDFNHSYKDQSMTKMGKLFDTVSGVLN
jgi:hypothetical protein